MMEQVAEIAKVHDKLAPNASAPVKGQPDQYKNWHDQLELLGTGHDDEQGYLNDLKQINIHEHKHFDFISVFHLFTSFFYNHFIRIEKLL